MGKAKKKWKIRSLIQLFSYGGQPMLIVFQLNNIIIQINLNMKNIMFALSKKENANFGKGNGNMKTYPRPRPRSKDSE